MLNLYEYVNYRHFLRDYYETKKSQNSKFSYRMFSRMAGFSSPSFIKLLIDGERNLSSKGVQRLAGGLKMDKTASQYFENLVQFQQAKQDEKKQTHFNRMAYFKKKACVLDLNDQYEEFLSKWYCPVIREMTLMKKFKEDPRWICDQLDQQITEDQARRALEIMKSLGLLIRDQNNVLRPSEPLLSTTSDKAPMILRETHKDYINKSAESFEKTHREFREISGLTVAVNQESYKKAKTLIQDFRRNLNVMLSQTKDVDAVYQLNFQFYNLTKTPWTPVEKQAS